MGLRARSATSPRTGVSRATTSRRPSRSASRCSAARSRASRHRSWTRRAGRCTTASGCRPRTRTTRRTSGRCTPRRSTRRTLAGAASPRRSFGTFSSLAAHCQVGLDARVDQVLVVVLADVELDELDLAGELARRPGRVVGADRRSRVRADGAGLIEREHERAGALDPARRFLVAVDRDADGAAITGAAAVVCYSTRTWCSPGGTAVADAISYRSRFPKL